jgi:FAD:protein FMN transferase
MTSSTLARGIAPAAWDWTALGCQVRLVVTDPERLPDACRILAADLAAVDSACSRFRPDSELSVLNRSGGRSIAVSTLFAEAVDAALDAAGFTGGLVDPTVGAAVLDAGYDRDFSVLPPDGAAVVVSSRTVARWDLVEFDRTARRVRVPAGMLLDLGATAKAWAADRSAARIAAQSGCGVLVSLGGDIAVAGRPPKGGWRVRVQDVTGHPDCEAPAGSAVVAIREGGLATSNVTARRWRRGGDVLHHIIDPRVGLPARPVWRTASVVADSCVRANAASTASVILGAAAPAWLDRVGRAARLVTVDGTVRTVGAWPGAVS